MKNMLKSRILAAVGLLSLAAAIGLVSSRPVHGVGGPVAVSVANTPLPTNPTDVAAPSQPVQFLLQPDTFGTGQTQVAKNITIPANKRLVIEYISAALGTGTGSVTVTTYAGGNYVAYYLIENSSSHTHQFFPTRIYADPGTIMSVSVTSANTQRAYADVEISGYYVNVP